MVGLNIDPNLPQRPQDDAGGGCGSCGSGDASPNRDNGLEKTHPTTAVRFGYMKHIGEFTYAPNMKFTCGAKVVMQTKRGLEIGEQVSLTCSVCDKAVAREEMKRYAQACDGETVVFDAGRIVREATMADLSEYARIQDAVSERRSLCQRLADKYELPMKVVDCEILFGGERVIFYFKAVGRVDFRQMVKDLSAELQTRIEMRQIGARDEARLLADYETCGREVCCKVFLKTLKPVSMKMAKLQKATIDPTKVSGRCGRLKCCLRYEHLSYEELDKELPKIGVRLRTRGGDGVVVERQILAQLLRIRKDDDGLVTVAAEDIITTLPDDVPEPSKPTVDDTVAEGSAADPEPKTEPAGDGAKAAKRPRSLRRLGRRGKAPHRRADAKVSRAEPAKETPTPVEPASKKNKDRPSTSTPTGGGSAARRRRWRRRDRKSAGGGSQGRGLDSGQPPD